MTNDLVSSAEIIGRLKQKRDEQNLSYSEIRVLIEQNGDYPPSVSTLSRVFSDGSENERFSYEDTIRPLAKALLDIETIEETDTDDVKTLKALLKLKMERIKDLETDLAKIKDKYNDKLDKERERYNRSIDFLKEQVSYKDKRMDMLLNAVVAKDKRYEELLDTILSCPCRKAAESEN